MTAQDPIVVEVGSAPISVTVASTGLVLSVATGTVGPAGAQGPAGSNGTNGQGVPTGGTTGQVLAKASGTNYDTEWVDQSGGGGSGTVTEVTGTAPISVATGTTTPVVSIAAASTSAAGSMSAADKSKLDGVEAAATANATNAQLRDRSTHTGTQAASTITGLATVATSGAHGDLTGLASGDPHTQYQRSESVFTSASSYTVTDESTVVSTGSTVVLPSAQAQAGRNVLVGAGADVTVTCAGTDVFLDGVGSTTFLVRTGNGVGFTSVDAGGTWGWAIVTRQGSTYDLPAWAGQSLAEGKVLRIDGTGAPAWANVAAADVPSLAASKITSGTFDTARLGSGTASASTFLRGDQTYQPVPVGNNDMGRVSNALYLTGSGLSLNGATSGNVVSTPDSTALDVTGDIEIVVRVALADWTLAQTQILVAKRQTASTRSYGLHVFSGYLYFATSTTGSDVVSSNSSATVGFSAGQAGWVRVTRNATTGAVTYYTAADSSSEPSSWTQLGTTQSTTASNIYSSNSQLEVGSNLNGSSPPTGTIYRAIVRSGIGGTTVFDADFSAVAADALAFTESSSNAATVTVTTTRYSYGVPGVQFTGTGTQALSANTVYYQPFEVTAPLTLDFMALEVTTAAGSNGNLRLGVYAADANLQPTGAPLFDSGDVTVTSGAAGILSKQGTAVTLQPGVYLTATNTSVALTARTALGGQTMVGTAMGSNLFTVLMSVAQTQGAFPTPGTAWTTRAAATGAARHVAQMRWR